MSLIWPLNRNPCVHYLEHSHQPISVSEPQERESDVLVCTLTDTDEWKPFRYSLMSASRFDELVICLQPFILHPCRQQQKKNNRLQSLINLPVVIHSFRSQHWFLLSVIQMNLVFYLFCVGTERRQKYSGYKRADHSFCILRC